MSTLDEIAQAEDQLASALEELQRHKRDENNWTFRAEKGAAPGLHSKVADLSPTYFPILEARQRAVDDAENRLRAVKRAWLRGLI